MRARKHQLQALAASGILAVGLLVPSAAFAQVSSGSGAGTVIPPQVLGETITPGTTPVTAAPIVDDTQVLGATVDANKLAFTGADVALTAAIGGSAVVIGGALLIARRRSA